jgi:predicted SprT family Zn-dependent metalloprotease
MKKTKRPKGVSVVWHQIEYVTEKSEYQCPCCKTVFMNTLQRNTSRFYCDCGQELIVKAV